MLMFLLIGGLVGLVCLVGGVALWRGPVLFGWGPRPLASRRWRRPFVPRLGPPLLLGRPRYGRRGRRW